MFEVGKYYKHAGGSMLHVLCETTTTLYGECLIAENAGEGPSILAVGTHDDSTTGYEESDREQWMKNFS